MSSVYCIMYMYIIFIIAWFQVSFDYNESIYFPLSEIICIVAGIALLYNAVQKKYHILIKGVGILYFVLYTVSCYYYYYSSGEWLSKLAISNANQLYILFDFDYFIILLILIGLTCGFYSLVNRLSLKNKQQILVAKVMLIISIICIQQFNFGNIKTGGINPTPVFTVLKNTYNLLASSNQGIDVAGYPFEKEQIYDNSLLSDNHVKTNVIIIFTEGTSARLLGCYGGRFDNLTPNIDDMSKNAMVVDNYYNHTAATFRGTLGQLSSAYILHGGYTNGGWGSGAKKLKTKKYCTIPKLLANAGYDTIFISPHATDDPYTDLLSTAGFQQIYTLGNIEQLLNYTPESFHSSVKDADMYRALKSALEHKNADRPLLLCMYTLDTHLGIELPPDGEKYNYNGEFVESLNSLHNLDKKFGEFWTWFKTSPYAENTIFIFTSDHAHFYDNSYVKLVANDEDYTKCFFDRIPLIIYDPVNRLSGRYDANDANSLALAPTVCNLLSINYVKNSFLGQSIFDHDHKMNIVASGDEYFYVYNHIVYKEQDIKNKLTSEQGDNFIKEKSLVELFYECETLDKLFH